MFRWVGSIPYLKPMVFSFKSLQRSVQAFFFPSPRKPPPPLLSAQGGSRDGTWLAPFFSQGLLPSPDLEFRTLLLRAPGFKWKEKPSQTVGGCNSDSEKVPQISPEWHVLHQQPPDGVRLDGRRWHHLGSSLTTGFWL